MWVSYLFFAERCQIFGALPLADQFLSHEFTLQFGTWPDATQRLEHPNKVQIVQFRVEHFQVERHGTSAVIDQFLLEKGMGEPVARAGDDAVVVLTSAVFKNHRFSFKSGDVQSWAYLAVTDFVEEFVVDGRMGSTKCFGYGAKSIDGIVTYKDFEHQFVEKAAYSQREPFGSFSNLIGGLSKQEFRDDVIASSPGNGRKGRYSAGFHGHIAGGVPSANDEHALACKGSSLFEVVRVEEFSGKLARIVGHSGLPVVTIGYHEVGVSFGGGLSFFFGCHFPGTVEISLARGN